MVHLSEGRISSKEWETRIFPLVEAGELKDRSKMLPNGFLVVYQTMECLLEDTDGTLYICTGWVPPGGIMEAHVDIKKWRGGEKLNVTIYGDKGAGKQVAGPYPAPIKTRVKEIEQ